MSGGFVVEGCERGCGGYHRPGMRTTGRRQAWHWEPYAVIALAAVCVVLVLGTLLVWDVSAWDVIAPVVGVVLLCVGFVAARHLH